MSRKGKHKVHLNNVENLQSLMQEVYNDCNFQIKEAQTKINGLTNGAETDDTLELVAVTKEAGNLLKIKDSSIKIKLDLAKLQNDILKNSAAIEKQDEGQTEGIGVATTSDFSAIREIVEKGKAQENNSISLK